MSVSISLLVLLPCLLNLWVSLSLSWLCYLCAIPGNLIHSPNENEIISLDNPSCCRQGWLLAFYHVSLLLAAIGTYIWVCMTFIDWCCCFGQQTAKSIWGGRSWAAPTCTECCYDDGWAMQHAESVSVSPIFSHQSLLLVLTTCFLSFLPSHLPKPQPAVRISFCMSPHTVNCCKRGMSSQKLPHWRVSVLWCVTDILACVSRHLCEQKASLELTEEVPWYLTNICIYANRSAHKC